MSRRGFMIVEMIVADAVFATVLCCLFMALGGGHRAADAARTTGALSGALLLSERIMEDVRQMGFDPASTVDLVVSPHRVCFYVATFVGVEIRLRKVSYSVVSSPGGALLIQRGEESVELGSFVGRITNHIPLSAVEFSMVTDRRFGGRSLRAVLTLPADERPGGLSNRDVTHEILARLPQAPAWGNPVRDPVRRVRTGGYALF